MADWHRYTLDVRMPQLAPGGRLSEVELLKQLGAYQWESIARTIGQPPSRLANAQGERLYASFVELSLHLRGSDTLESLGEDTRIHVSNRVSFFRGKFVEGLTVFGRERPDDDTLAAIGDRAALEAGEHSWACMTNAFIAREGANTRLKVFKPAVEDGRSLPSLARPPHGIAEQMRVQAGDALPLPGDDGQGIALRPLHPGPVVYPVVPESDLNGAGLLYFARYPAIMAYAERVLLTERLEPPVSRPLVACLSTRQRRIVYFANASDTDAVEVRIAARVTPGEAPSPGDPYQTPLMLWLDVELRRASDKVCMARSTALEALRVPGDAKAVRLEAERWLASLRGSDA